MQVYHNPRCGKSRNCLAYLTENNIEFETIKYLEQTPSKKQIIALLEMLEMAPLELVRKKEKIWIERYKNQSLTDDAIVDALVENPILIERPIIIKDGKATIARDLESIQKTL
ncbi:arsenate reductase (glutaredoxin) [Flavobacterium sp. 14A]|uniref:arsenate reductase (glutaredoxin) n=1 Tax=Flavobacterium sp. 14A TaxID=2735896 RepID=UPI00156E00EC|nr:arsenate reductase (glutaredoxin) [Flavobacterium sp. 14A]NRT11958.1 arsenate reductase [Flavobacterium sp. 14A]